LGVIYERGLIGTYQNWYVTSPSLLCGGIWVGLDGSCIGSSFL
jgi:hypothetical protein